MFAFIIMLVVTLGSGVFWYQAKQRGRFDQEGQTIWSVVGIISGLVTLALGLALWL